MIVYAQRERTVRPKTLESLADPLDALIEWGEVESAVADAGYADETLCGVMLDTARVYWSGTGRLPRFDASALPETVEVSIPEGYAFYALHPRSYAEAAVRFWEDARPRAVVVIGIRSIGTSLSAVVCAALEERGCAVRRYTVRPGGHP